MNPGTRRILRWSFIIVFLVAAPLLVLWTAGYRYSFSQGRLERTGVIFVESTPSGATINLDGVLRKERTPARLTRLFAGAHRLRLEKDGYGSWTADVVVPSGGTSFLNDIALFRQELPALQNEFPYASAAFSYDGGMVAFLREADGFAELQIVDTRRGTTYLPYRAELTDVPSELSWSADGSKLLVRRLHASRSVFLVWDAARPDTVTDLRTHAPQTPFTNAFWSDDGRTLYAADNATLYAIEPGPQPLIELGPSLDGMRVKSGVVYGFSQGENGTDLMTRSLRDSAWKRLTVLGSGAWQAIDVSGPMLVFRKNGEERLVFIEPGGGGEAASYEARGLGVDWSPDGRALYWSRLELRVFDPRARTDSVVTRIGGTLRSARWYPVGDTVLFITSTGLSAADLGSQGRPIEPLAGFTRLDAFEISADGARAVFAGTIGRRTGLWTMRLR